MEIRFLQLQNTLWSYEHVLFEKTEYIKKFIQKNRKKYKNNFILRNILLMNENNINIKKEKKQIIKNNRIIGGKLLIRDVLDINIFLEHRKILRENNLMFLDQITTLRGDYMLTWNMANKKRYFNRKSNGAIIREPLIYKIIREKITTNLNGKLEQKFVEQKMDNKKGHIMINASKYVSSKGRTFVIFWDNGLQIGKRINCNTNGDDIKIQHYSNRSEINGRDLCLQKCKGCNLSMNTQNYRNECILNVDWRQVYDLEIKQNKKRSYKDLEMIILEGIQYLELFDILNLERTFRNNPSLYIPQDIRHFMDLREYNYIDSIDKYIDTSIDKNELYKARNKIIFSRKMEFIVYTDGSMRDYNSVNAQITFGTNIYDIEKNLISEFYSTAEHNLSVIRAELLAILTSVIILPEGSKAAIYTDSKIIFEFFTEESNFNLNCRKIFKIDNNNILKQYIIECIKERGLYITWHKVKSHDSDEYNNRIDKYVKEIYNSIEEKGLNIRSQMSDRIRFVPCWRNVVIEKNLRKFLRMTSNVSELENFLNLNRNAKYRINDIDTELTFKLIKGKEKALITNNEDHKLRRKKMKLLIEEVSCIEQVKKSLFAIYKDRLCPYCNTEKETFNHIWTCQDRITEIEELINETKLILIEKVNGHIEQEQDKIQIQDLNIGRNLWDSFYSFNDLTFIDLIKGIIPKWLSNLVAGKIKNKVRTENIFIEFRDSMINKGINKFWNKRCEILNNIDKDLGIDKKLKKEKRNVEKFKYNRPVYDIPKYEQLDSILYNSYFGMNIQGFMMLASLYSYSIPFLLVMF